MNTCTYCNIVFRVFVCLLGGRESRDDSHVSLQNRGREESRRARQMRRNSSLVTTTHRGDPWPGPGLPPRQCFPLALCFFCPSFWNLLSTKALTLCFPGGPQVVGPLPRTAVMVSLLHLSFTSATLTSDLHPGGSWVNATRS